MKIVFYYLLCPVIFIGYVFTSPFSILGVLICPSYFEKFNFPLLCVAGFDRWCWKVFKR
jgi:hypothetical protein